MLHTEDNFHAYENEHEKRNSYHMLAKLQTTDSNIWLLHSFIFILETINIFQALITKFTN